MELIKPKDLAKKLGITTTTLSRWAKSGVVEDKTKEILGVAYTIAKKGPTGRVLYYAPVGEIPELFEKPKKENKMEKAISINGEAPLFFTIEEFAKIAKTTPAEIKKWISGGEKYFQMMAKTRTGGNYGFFTGLDDKIVIAEIPEINPNLGGENETTIKVKTLDAEIASALKDLKEAIEEQKSVRLGGPELVKLIPVLLQTLIPLIVKKMEKSNTAALEYMKAFQQGLQMGLQLAEERGEPEEEDKPAIDINSIIQALPHILPMIQQQRKQNGDSIKKIQGSSETGTDTEHNLQDAEFPVGTATGPFGPNSEDIFQ